MIYNRQSNNGAKQKPLSGIAWLSLVFILSNKCVSNRDSRHTRSRNKNVGVDIHFVLLCIQRIHERSAKFVVVD